MNQCGYIQVLLVEHIKQTINMFNSVTFLCLSPARIWISNAICHGFIFVKFIEVSGACRFVVIGGIADYHCVNFL